MACFPMNLTLKYRVPSCMHAANLMSTARIRKDTHHPIHMKPFVLFEKYQQTRLKKWQHLCPSVRFRHCPSFHQSLRDFPMRETKPNAEFGDFFFGFGPSSDLTSIPSQPSFLSSLHNLTFTSQLDVKVY